MQDYKCLEPLSEENCNLYNSDKIFQKLVNNHEAIILMVRNNIIPISSRFRDMGTNSYMKGLMEQHEKMALSLTSYES